MFYEHAVQESIRTLRGEYADWSLRGRGLRSAARGSRLQYCEPRELQLSRPLMWSPALCDLFSNAAPTSTATSAVDSQDLLVPRQGHRRLYRMAPENRQTSPILHAELTRTTQQIFVCLLHHC